MYKQIAGNLINGLGNAARRGLVSKISDLEIVALKMILEAVGVAASRCCFQSYMNIEVNFPILYSVRNVMTDVR